MHDDWGKIVKKGGGTLILAASGTMKYGITANQDYFTAIDLQQGTLKFPQHAVGNMYFGDLTMADGTTLVTCGDVSDPSQARADVSPRCLDVQRLQSALRSADVYVG